MAYDKQLIELMRKMGKRPSFSEAKYLVGYLSESHDIDVPFVLQQAGKYRNKGAYSTRLNAIMLWDGFTISTILHEFRHHYQHTHSLKISEDDANWWSKDLLQMAFPN